jgi:predicted glycosyltransferase
MCTSRHRIALYSHDTMGIGHMRRNMLIAQAFAESDVKPNILMICGAREAALFTPPPGVDFLTLPAISKDASGRYHPRCLDVTMRELSRVRSDVTRAALEAFDPDVLIVDKVPRGALGELDSSLASLRAAGHTRCVLGLRDVLDDANSVAREWISDDSEQAVREYYDAVWVYGSAGVYDVAREYHFSPDVAEKIRYTGYLRRTLNCDSVTNGETIDPVEHLDIPSDAPVALCMVGGGQDGADVALNFARAVLPENMIGVIVTGPFMPPEAKQRIKLMAASRPQLRVLEFTTSIEPLLRRAGHVVTMGGYNSVCEVLAAGKRALVVPRVKPRLEQFVRAQSLQRMGLLDVLHPDDLSPQAIARWLSRPIAPPSDVVRRLDFDGTRRLASLLADVLATDSDTTCRCRRGAMQHVA